MEQACSTKLRWLDEDPGVRVGAEMLETRVGRLACTEVPLYPCTWYLMASAQKPLALR